MVIDSTLHFKIQLKQGCCSVFSSHNVLVPPAARWVGAGVGSIGIWFLSCSVIKMHYLYFLSCYERKNCIFMMDWTVWSGYFRQLLETIYLKTKYEKSVQVLCSSTQWNCYNVSADNTLKNYEKKLYTSWIYNRHLKKSITWKEAFLYNCNVFFRGFKNKKK